MGWLYGTGDEYLSAHVGDPAALLAVPLPPNVAVRHGLDPDDTETRAWSPELAGYITGWRAACACGWRGEQRYPRAEYRSEVGDYPDEVRQACEADWTAHVEGIMPEHQIRTAARQASAAHARFADAVRDARGAGVSWEAIGRASGTSGKAAQERWGYLDVLHDASTAR